MVCNIHEAKTTYVSTINILSIDMLIGLCVNIITINHSFCTAFPSNKQSPINPRNTSYDYIDRPGESLLDDANEDIVCRWLAEDGIGMPHHRDSDYHRRHKNNAQIGLPIRARKQSEVVWKGVSIEPGMI